jgi:tetratricopeptide (TPR) repeat protein
MDLKSRYELAAVYEFKRMPKEREQQFLEIVEIAPTDANYARLGILYADRGDVEKALEPARKADELKPNHVYFATLSHYYEKLGRIDDAIQMAKRSVELKPAGLENRIILGDLWLKKGNRQEALREYQEGFAVAAGDPRPNFKLAWLYIRMGNRDGAFRHYSILKGIAPGGLGNLELCLRAHFGNLQ